MQRNTYVTAAALAAALLVAGCSSRAAELRPSDASTVLANHTIDAPDPSRPGPHTVGYLTYGSGDDRNRSAYRDSVAFTTDKVDGSAFVSLGGSARSRKEYWGFGPDEMPLNARVWYPEGEGPFPLVLVVHGNHDMTDYSDPGYDYLGELLASRGFILASVDMNFINGGIRGENDGRGWLLLEHLEAWQGFNEDRENPFFGRVDMGRIGLMGHSRVVARWRTQPPSTASSATPTTPTSPWISTLPSRASWPSRPWTGSTPRRTGSNPWRTWTTWCSTAPTTGTCPASWACASTSAWPSRTGAPHFKRPGLRLRRQPRPVEHRLAEPRPGPRSGRSLDLDVLIPGEDQRQFAKVYIVPSWRRR